MIVVTGDLHGRGGHILRGRFSFRREAGRLRFETSEDFFFDGAPSPGWALFHTVPASGQSEGVREAAATGHFGMLAPASDYPYPETRGPQHALLPEALRLDGCRSLFLWCYGTHRLLGVGPFAETP